MKIIEFLSVLLAWPLGANNAGFYFSFQYLRKYYAINNYSKTVFTENKVEDRKTWSLNKSNNFRILFASDTIRFDA